MTLKFFFFILSFRSVKTDQESGV